MAIKVFSGIVALLLVLAFVVPPAVKLKDVALAIVIGIGVVLMLIDLWQSLQKAED